MVIKGRSRRNIKWWTRHLQKDEENDRVDLIEKRGVMSAGLADMMREMEQAAGLSGRCKNFMYIASFNPQAHEHPTEPQWERMLEIFEQQRGIPEGTPRVVIEHEKKGRTHRHVIWQRVDLETMRAFPDGLDRVIGELAAKEIEKELGFEQTPKFIDREPGTPAPPRGPKAWEMYRGLRTGIDPRDITAEVTELRQQSDNGQAFKAALEEHGYELVTGKRGLLILDSAGKEHSLARRCGMEAKELNAFMRDVDRAALPTVEQAKAAFQDRKIAGLEADRATVAYEIAWEEKLAQAAIEKEKQQPQFSAKEDRQKETRAGGWIDARITAAQGMGISDERNKVDDIPHAKAFAEALEQKGIAFAVVTPEESYRSHREQAFAKAVGRKSDYFAPGEIVAVTEPGLLYHRAGEWTEPPRVHKLDQQKAVLDLSFLSIDKSKLKGIDATKSMLDANAQTRAAYWQEIRLDNATTRQNHRVPEHSQRDRAAEKIVDTGASLAAGTVGKGLDIAASLFEGLLAPKLTPEQKREGEFTRQEREANAAQALDFSRFTADRAQEHRNHQEQQAARDRQRELERDR